MRTKKIDILKIIEKIGNKLPQPINIFIILIIGLLLIAHILYLFDVKVLYHGLNVTTGNMEEMSLKVNSLLTLNGMKYILNNMTTNFTNFAPLGTVLVAMLGVGVAENTGFLGTALKKIVISAPPRLITFVVVLTGVLSNIAGDAGIVVLPPLAAVLFLALGRHPLAGFAAAFAGQSGGFSANLLLGTVDPLLAGITTEAAKLVDPNALITASANWYFMSASTFIIALAGTFVTEKIVIPKLGNYNDDNSLKNINKELTNLEKRGLKYATLAMIIFVITMLLLVIPNNSIFRENGNLNKYVSNGLVPSIMLFFMIPGVIYGIFSKTIKTDKDFSDCLVKSMSSMGAYIALSFFAAQFISYFSYTNMGTILAVKGATFLQSINFTGFPLILCFIAFSGFINLFIGSASAKWAIMAPIFVPLLMQLGYSPAFSQIGFRIGDSVTNIITPLMPYFGLLVTFAQKYDKKLGVGNMITIMAPYSIAFCCSWILLLFIWFILRLPIGPGCFILL